jgi:hypothetical protein
VSVVIGRQPNSQKLFDISHKINQPPNKTRTLINSNINIINKSNTKSTMPSNNNSSASELAVYANLVSYKYDGDSKTHSANRGGDANDMSVYGNAVKVSLHGLPVPGLTDDDDDSSVVNDGRLLVKDPQVVAAQEEDVKDEQSISVDESQLLSTRKAFAPCTDPNSIIKVSLDHRHGFLGRRGNVRVLDSAGKPFAGGVHLKEFQRHLLRPSYLLRTANKTPVALCVQQKAQTGSSTKVFNIYSTRQGVTADVTKVVHVAGVSYYPAYRVELASAASDCVVSTWTGKESVPIWELRTEANTVTIQDINVGRILGSIEQHEGLKTGCDIVLNAGVDPALVLCVGTILEAISFV